MFTRQDLVSLPGFDLATWSPDEEVKKTRGVSP
jgi:hypothetical protein